MHGSGLKPHLPFKGQHFSSSYVVMFAPYLLAGQQL